MTRPFNIGLGVELMPMRIELLRACHRHERGAFSFEFEVLDRVTSEPFNLGVSLPAPSGWMLQDTPDAQRLLVKALAHALRDFLGHEVEELIRVDGKPAFEHSTRRYHR